MTTAYLLGLMVLMVNVWDIKPFCFVPRDGYLLLTFFYLLFSLVLFPGKKKRLSSEQICPFLLIIAGIFISMIPAKLFYNQSILQSLLTYRSQILWMAVPIVMRLRPRTNEIFKASMCFTILMCFVTILHSFSPSMFLAREATVGVLASNEYLVSGVAIAVLPLIISMNRMSRRFNASSFAIVVICLLFFFFAQNRTCIFAVIMVAGYMLFLSKFKYKYVLLVIMLLLSCLFVAKTIEIWLDLFNETVEQIYDSEYNRNKALLYFFSSLANPSWVTYLTGNGFLSAHSTTLMADMMLEGVYNSDVGFVGFWNQFGILPIIAFFMLIFKGFSKNSSPIAKGCALFMLLTSMTIGYYADIPTLLLFIFIYYFIEEPKHKYFVLEIKDGHCGE